jgi:hypothetical protein
LQGYLAPGNVTLLTSQCKSGKFTLLSVLLARLKTGGLLAGLPVAPGKAAAISAESAEQWLTRSRKRLDLPVPEGPYRRRRRWRRPWIHS